MSIINVNNISHSWDYGDHPVFQNISFSLVPGEKAGLIGPNGCGKTTLLRIICGELEPSSGSVIRSSQVSRYGYLPQQTDVEMTVDLYTFLCSADPEQPALMPNRESGDRENDLGPDGGLDKEKARFRARIERTLKGFGFTAAQWAQPLNDLSSGQRSRAWLARTILSDPEVLFLDEPTNHLDLAGREFLEEFLLAFKGAALIVSHDRYFLNRVAGRILDLRRGRLNEYPGNYDSYAALRLAREGRQWQEYELHNKTIRKLETEATARMAWSQRTERGWKREPGDKQPDDKAKRYAKKMARRAKAVRTKIEQKLEREKADKPFVEKRVKLKFPEIDILPGYALTADGLAKRYGSHPVLADLSLDLHQGERLAITGPNGCGKSTLIKILAGELKPDAGQFRWAKRAVLGYYPQEQLVLDPAATALDEVMKCGCTAEQAWSFLGALMLREDYVLKTTAQFSAGERAKIILARLLLSGANVLLLDEPTNHLDIDSTEALERALLEYTGTILMVSHDRYLTGKLATRMVPLDRNPVS